MSEFFILRDGAIKGPYSLEKIKDFALEGKLKASDQISKKKEGPWQEVVKIKGLNITSFLDNSEKKGPTVALKHQQAISPNEKGKGGPGRGKLFALGGLGLLVLLLLGGVGASWYFFFSGIRPTKANPYLDFSVAYEKDRKLEWEKLVAADKAKQELDSKTIDELEKLYEKNRKKKNISNIFLKDSANPYTPLKAFRTLARNSNSKIVFGDDAEAFQNQIISNVNSYFSSHASPSVSADATCNGEIEVKSSEKIKYNALPNDAYERIIFKEKPIEELELAPNIAFEIEKKGDLDHLLCLPIGVEAKSNLAANLDDFAIEAQDKDSKVLSQGRLKSKIALAAGKTIEIKGYLIFTNIKEIERISKFVIGKRPDNEYLTFVSRLNTAIESGAVNDISNVVLTMKPSWSKKFVESSEESLKTAKPTARLGIAKALEYFLINNVDKESFSILEKLIADEDASVSNQAIYVASKITPCPQNVIQKIMWAASNRKDDAKKEAVNFIQKLDHKVPENIALFLKEVDNPDQGIKVIAANFLVKCNLDAKQNLDLGTKFIVVDQEEVAIAGMLLLKKQAETDRAKVMVMMITHLSNKFDSCRQMADQVLTAMAPMKIDDLPALTEGLKDKTPDSKIRLIGYISGMKADAKSAAPALAGLLKDDSEKVRIDAIACLATLKADPKTVSIQLYEASRDKAPPVRAEAIKALAKIGRDPKTVELLFDEMADANPQVVQACVDGFGELKPPINKADLSIIGPRLSSQSLPIKKKAFSALETIGKDGVVYAKEVGVGLDDSDQDVLLAALNCANFYPDKIQNGKIKVEKLLGDKLVSSTDERQAISALNYLATFGPQASTAVPILKKLFQNGQHSQKTVPALKLARAIGKDCNQVVPEMIRMITKPQLFGNVLNQQQAKNLMEIILKTKNNESLRDAMAATGESGAKVLGKYVLDPDPMIRVFSLMALENMGTDAKPVMPTIYSVTIPNNAKSAAVLYIAQVVYGRLQGVNGK